MNKATRGTEDACAEYFFLRYAVKGRAVLMSSPRSAAWSRTLKRGARQPEDPELWLCRLGVALVAVDDYDPMQSEGYLYKCQPHDTVGRLVNDWLLYRQRNRALIKLAKCLRTILRIRRLAALRTRIR
jgi:hypothetical protein